MMARRVVVVGASCAGKSTFARALAAAHGSDCIDLDDLFWAPGWQPRPREDFLDDVRARTRQDDWVVAGNYAVARAVIWPRATGIVWLDLSLPHILWRWGTRTWRRASRGEVLAHGNRETFGRTFFSRESLLWWILKTYGPRRKEFTALRHAPEFAHLTWFVARSPREADTLLRRLQVTDAAGAPIEERQP